jgi:PiT family inorganic phosphate transporter
MLDPLHFAVLIIGLALFFDFLNGFHDAANAIATVVVSRTLTPLQAVVMAGAANFIGYFAFGTTVAKMIGKGVVQLDAVTLPLIMATLIGAICWNIITWLFGLPTSSSHALIGGLVGSGIAAVGLKVVIWTGVLKIFIFIFLAPIIGMAGAIIFTTLIFRLFRNIHPGRAKGVFKKLQLVSSIFFSIGHGTNDAQKTMGIIALVLYASGMNASFRIDSWVILACYTAIALGTFFGGWRIVRTMGTKITKIGATEGFCAETAAACVLLGTQHLGIPVSTTHVIAGSIMGVGAVKPAATVRWVTARRIVWSWLLTIPLTAACSAVIYNLVAMVRLVH